MAVPMVTRMTSELIPYCAAHARATLYLERAHQLRCLARAFKSVEARMQLTMLAAMYETLAQGPGQLQDNETDWRRPAVH